MINVEHLARLCELLWCEPNDLFEWQPATEHTIPDNHPLFNLKTNKEAAINLRKMTATVPYKDLKDISSVLEREIEDRKK